MLARTFTSRCAVALVATSAISLWSSKVFAQATPVITSITAETGRALERNVDDLTRAFTEAGQNESHRGGARERVGAAPGISVSGFTLGRLYTSENEGLRSNEPGVSRSVPFDSYERSAFGSLVLRSPAFGNGGRLNIGVFAGVSQLDMDLFAQPIAGIGADPGKAVNEAFMYGGAINYTVGQFYATMTAVGSSGETQLNDYWNGAQFNLPGGVYRRQFDTAGYVVSGVSGVVLPLGGSFFAGVEGGVRHLNFETDRFLSQLGGLTFQQDMQATTAMGAIGLFTVIQTGDWTTRPYVRASLQHDVDFSLTALQRDAQTGILQEAIVFTREATVKSAEAGLNWTNGNVNVSAAGFVESAADQSTLGGRLGVKVYFD